MGQASSALGSRDEDPEQLALLPPTRFEGSAADEQRAKLEKAHAGRGGGRPLGAQNRVTVQFRKWLLSTGEDPLESMMRWSMHTPETLAKELGCTIAEAFDRLMSLKDKLAVYLHPRMAPVNDQGQAVPMFQMVFGSGSGVVVRTDQPPWLSDPEVAAALGQGEQNQGLSEPGSVRPENQGSHDNGQSADDAGESGD